MRSFILIAAFVAYFFCGTLCSTTAAQTISVELRYQELTSEGSNRYHRLNRAEQWQPAKTAVIVCDMWDAHHCVNAVRRVGELAPRIDLFCRALREQGVTIIHAPSSCMETYQDNAARQRAKSTPLANSLPDAIGDWCDQIPSEEVAAYPIDQADGGEDDDPSEHQQWADRLTALGLNPRAPWTKQVAAIHIDAKHDYISDSGTEIWSILAHRGIDNVILVGVHTNMCVLGRPFGLRRLASGGKNVVLARDLTDTMYDYRAWPYASHFTGTDLIVDHIERYVCPTIASNQVLGGEEFRFAEDSRKRLVMLIAEDEYETATTLPAFAAKHLSQHFRITTCFGNENDRADIVGIEQVASADALLVSVRRRPLPTAQLAIIKDFVAQGKPVIGIRTASHAFTLRNQEAPTGTENWPEFDADVFGGSYTNHYGNDLKSTLSAQKKNHSILAATNAASIQPAGSLYKTAPLAPGADILVQGRVLQDAALQGEAEGKAPEPVAWTFIRNDGGRSFYTSLGHPGDFKQPAFESLLAAGIHWACGLEPQSFDEIQAQNERYAAGGGKQRK